MKCFHAGLAAPKPSSSRNEADARSPFIGILPADYEATALE
jgi:hypothetical protein